MNDCGTVSYERVDCFNIITLVLSHWKASLWARVVNYINHDVISENNHNSNIFVSLIFLRPNIEPLDFWAVLWAVVVTSFVIKFLCMGTKCLILLLPPPVMSYRTQVRARQVSSLWKKYKWSSIFLRYQSWFSWIFVSPGFLHDSYWRAWSALSVCRSSFTVVPLPDILSGSWWIFWSHTEHSFDTVLHYTEGEN